MWGHSVGKCDKVIAYIHNNGRGTKRSEGALGVDWKGCQLKK